MAQIKLSEFQKEVLRELHNGEAIYYARGGKCETRKRTINRTTIAILLKQKLIYKIVRLKAYNITLKGAKLMQPSTPTTQL